MSNISLKILKLVNFKGFREYSISLRRVNILIGANNSGKSTALSAIRLIAAMLPQAKRIRPKIAGMVEGQQYLGWAITAAAVEASAFSLENLRHDFRSEETRIEIILSNKVRLVASWRDLDEDDGETGTLQGTFFVIPPDGFTARSSFETAKALVPSIAVVPTLTPLDDREGVVSSETLRKHQTSRRSSRYFRNALDQLDQNALDDFLEFVHERTPEMTNLSLHRSFANSDDQYDLFYEEEGTRSEREIGWAGDGMQIWIQALFHVWNQSGFSILILDEPDVFLHPDLQRRLARTIFANDQQIILATHSIEILAEAEPGSTVWIDRSRRRSERPRSDGALGLMGRRLGSGYELGVGRALRSHVAVFVEGNDIPIVSHLARRLRKDLVSSSEKYATIPLGGFTRNSLAAGFAETMSALGSDVSTFVILDRDLRSDENVKLETQALKRAGADVHVWKRREIENYLLSPRAISMVSGLQYNESAEILHSAILELENEARDTLQAQRLQERRLDSSSTKSHSELTVLKEAGREFDALWSTPEGRVSTVDAKAVMKTVNRRLQALNAKTINAHSLARSIPPAEIDPEVKNVIEQISQLIMSQ